MAQTNDILTEIAVKRLSGKAQSSTKLSLAQESFGSTVQSTAKTVFGESVVNEPSQTFFTNQTNVQKVVFELEPIADSKYTNVPSDGDGETTVFTFHAYALKLTSSYNTEAANDYSGRGTIPYSSSYFVSGSGGRLQIVPEYMSSIPGSSNPYIPVLKSTNGATISATDAIDWYLDAYSGILFVQDPLDYGTSGSPNSGAQIPNKVEAFIYTGQFVDQRLDAAGTGGSGGGHFLVTGSASSPISASLNVGTNDIFKITSASQELVSLSTTGGETNFNINGNLVATKYIVSSSVTFMTQSFSSGSTAFGDSFDDTHIFTGSLFFTGSSTYASMSNSSFNEIAYVTQSADGRTGLRFSHIIDGGSF